MMMKFPLALALLAASLAAGETGVVIQRPNELDWKVSGSLPAGMATHEYHLIYEDKTTRGVQTLVRFSKGYALPAHSHTHDEVILVLKGKIALEAGGGSSILGQGAYALIPGGTTHALRNAGWGPCEFLASFAGPVDFKELPRIK